MANPNYNFGAFNEVQPKDVYRDQNDTLKYVEGITFKNAAAPTTPVYRGTALKITGDYEVSPLLSTDTDIVPVGFLLNVQDQDIKEGVNIEGGAVDGNRISMDANFTETMTVLANGALPVGSLVVQDSTYTSVSPSYLPKVQLGVTNQYANLIVLKAGAADNDEIIVGKLRSLIKIA